MSRGALERLLERLRAAGLRIGPGEELRLRHVLARAGTLDEEELHTVLRASLARGEDEERELARCLQGWIAEQEAAPAGAGRRRREHPAAPTPALPAADETAKSGLARRRRARWVVLGLACAAAAALAVAAWRLWAADEPPPQTPAEARPVVVAPREAEREGPELLAQLPSFLAWEPVLVPRHGPAPFPARLAASLLAALALAGGGAVWWRFRREPRPELRAESGPGRREPLPIRAGRERVTPLIGREGVRTLVWGVGRFVSEEPTQRIDLARTVGATARLGELAIVRERAAYERAVWLWEDDALDDQRAARVADELERSLLRAGLSVRRGVFDGSPEQVTWLDGDTFSPLIHEGGRRDVMVAVLTDGRGLRDRAELVDTAARQRLFLNALGGWPHLAFADFGEGAHGLGPLLRPHSIACLWPEALPQFFGLGERRELLRHHPPPRLTGELRAWAAVLALDPAPFDEGRALAVHRALGLSVSPHLVAALRAHAEPAGIGLRWPTDRRRELLRWLSASAAAEPHGIARPGSLLARAAGYWRQCCEEDDDARLRRATAESPWEGTREQRLLHAKRALAVLWIAPLPATEVLWRLCREDPGLAPYVRNRLGELAPREHEASPNHIALPWSWGDQPQDVQHRLWAMGFAEELWSYRDEPQMTRGHRLALAVCLAVVVAGVIRAVAGSAVRAGAIVWELPETAVPSDFRLVQIGTRVTVSTPNGEASAELSSGADLVVGARPTRLPSVATGEDGLERWRWGSVAQISYPAEAGSVVTGFVSLVERPSVPAWPARSQLVIVGKREEEARRLALAWLDMRMVDEVVWCETAAAMEQLEVWEEAKGQRIVIAAAGVVPPQHLGRHVAILTSDWTDLLDLKPGSAWRDRFRGTVAGGKGVLLLRGGPASVELGPGSFTMGSPPEESQWDEERPQHTVSVSGFAMDRFEVTTRLFHEVMGRETTGDTRATSASWFEAVRFCNALSEECGLEPCYDIGDGEQPEVTWKGGNSDGYRLPTEAEWEYAARAGESAAYFFGVNEAELPRYAWKDGEAHPVGQKEASPWGLHDIYGNVLEWCWDWFDSRYYGASPSRDPRGPERGEARSLRGGSSWNLPTVLRSAWRLGFRPVVGDVFCGFRCVRAARRQS